MNSARMTSAVATRPFVTRGRLSLWAGDAVTAGGGRGRGPLCSLVQAKGHVKVQSGVFSASRDNGWTIVSSLRHVFACSVHFIHFSSFFRVISVKS